jgi:uncharacterized protein HemX
MNENMNQPVNEPVNNPAPVMPVEQNTSSQKVSYVIGVVVVVVAAFALWYFYAGKDAMNTTESTAVTGDPVDIDAELSALEGEGGGLDQAAAAAAAEVSSF